MAVNRAEIVEQNFLRSVSDWRGVSAAPPDAAGVDPVAAVEVFRSQVVSRLLDFQARKLKERDQGYYTIGSAGHEGNAAVARALRPDDPCFLHYRSGAFMVERLRADPTVDAIESILLSLCAAADDPVSGGRHKVWGSRKLWVPPQTSTIASHLPKAVGMAVAIERARRAKIQGAPPADAIAVASFGDASLNHSTAQGALNAALWSYHQRLPVPALFVCEDNGIGISVRTPQGWVRASVEGRPGLKYFSADGLDLIDALRVSAAAVAWCREKRQPTFLHLRTVRLLGHAGSDVETEYLSREQIEASEALDPLPASAARLFALGWTTPAETLDFYAAKKAEIEAKAARAAARPRLGERAEVMRPLAPHDAAAVGEEAGARNRAAAELGVPGTDRPRHMAMLINWALADALQKYPEALVFGEDVAKKGGVYHVTAGLHERFGAGRVFNTLLDEQTILGLAIGTGHAGFLPIPEIQYLAYFHNAEDQIRGEAASMQFFSNGQFKNPMVVRVASFAYQKGFGGHFHNDNALGALRDIPGVAIAAPARGDDAVKMLRTLTAMARVHGRVSFFLEPIALYMTKDLHAEGDGLWSFAYPAPGEAIALGEVGVYNPAARDVAIVSYANGLRFSLRAAERLKERGIGAKVIDLRWLAPLPIEALRRETSGFARVLVVDECRRTGGGIADAVTAALHETRGDVRVASVTAEDSYIPLGPAANLVLPSEEGIAAAILTLIGEKK